MNQYLYCIFSNIHLSLTLTLQCIQQMQPWIQYVAQEHFNMQPGGGSSWWMAHCSTLTTQQVWSKSCSTKRHSRGRWSCRSESLLFFFSWTDAFCFCQAVKFLCVLASDVRTLCVCGRGGVKVITLPWACTVSSEALCALPLWAYTHLLMRTHR